MISGKDDHSSQERVIRYEEILDRLDRVAQKMERALDDYESIQDDLRILEAYYCSPEWKADYDADALGLFPDTLKRGVLSQDGIDHMLDRYRELRDRMKE